MLEILVDVQKQSESKIFLVHGAALCASGHVDAGRARGEAPDEDVRHTFIQYVRGDIASLPWCDVALHAETSTVQQELAAANSAGFLTINSQPRVNGALSDDPLFGWGGPGGRVYQKAYECFVSPDNMKVIIDNSAKKPSVQYHAVNLAGHSYSNASESAVAVTWGVFPNMEILQPTIVDSSSFLVWKDEVFALWLKLWVPLYEEGSQSAKLLRQIHDTYYLVSIVDNDFVDGNIWDLFEQRLRCKVKKVNQDPSSLKMNASDYWDDGGARNPCACWQWINISLLFNCLIVVVNIAYSYTDDYCGGLWRSRGWFIYVSREPHFHESNCCQKRRTCVLIVEVNVEETAMPTKITNTAKTHITENDFQKIPVIGIGVYQSEPGPETYNAIASALKLDYRHIDTAQYYESATRDSGIHREDIFVTSKLHINHCGYEKALATTKVSNEKLGLGYIDLLHAPGDAATRAESWKALEELQEEGILKDVGVSNFGEAHLEKLMKTAKVKPAVNQVELHPWLMRPTLVKYCKENGILLEAYSPLARAQKMDDATLNEIATEIGVTPAQVLVAFSLANDFITIPNSVHEERQKANFRGR
ncbi:unnamed protein product [Phytophthora lilii]|uniref:Unnamed protein product n=1 Tax=Phytophthora lilii TaxID=2077276 RepID=A0A9W6TBK2_9STRA|nr:unnamed protein product [Phytophthora lilii]